MILSLSLFGTEIFTLAFGRVNEGFEYISNASIETELEHDEEEPMAFGFATSPTNRGLND